MSARTLVCFVSCLVIALLIAFSNSSAESGERTVIPYLPEELGEMPPWLMLFEDRSGYWAGYDAPVVRYIEFYRNQEMLDSWGEIEIAPGVVLRDTQKSILLFYYLGDDGSWHRIGHFDTYAVTRIHLRRPLFGLKADPPITGGLMGIGPGLVSKARITCKTIIVEANHSGGNDYREPWINMFSFVPDGSGGVYLVDNTIHITCVSIKEIYDFEGDFEPEFIGYAGWQLWGDVCHAASPDRQLILALNDDSSLVNVSARFPGFYVEGLSRLEAGLYGQVKRGYAQCFNDVRNDYYIGYVITTLIYYHDMGKHDEGVACARELFAREYFASEEEYESRQALIDKAVEKLVEQDTAIRESINEYNAVHAVRSTS